MSDKRKKHGAEFKAKVALAARNIGDALNLLTCRSAINPCQVFGRPKKVRIDAAGALRHTSVRDIERRNLDQTRTAVRELDLSMTALARQLKISTMGDSKS
jgi:hypothetical protein